MNVAQPVRIIGGGLAGLSLGIALQRANVPTEIFEAGDYPRHRVCGEFLTGLDDRTIEKLGVGPAFSAVGCHRSVTWFLRERVVGRHTLPSPARAISRFALDGRLAELFVAAGGKLSTHTRLTPPAVRSGWVATGGRVPSSSSPWIGLKLHARNLATTDDLEFHLGDDAYVGLSSVEEGWVNVCGVFRRRPGLQFGRDQALSTYLRASGMHALAERLATAQIRPGSRCAVAAFTFDRRVQVDDGVRLGDSCAMIPPFTGNGMAMAFTSAALALEPLIAWAGGKCSWRDTEDSIRKALRREFRLRLASAAFLHPFFLSHSLQRCLGIVARARLLPITPLYRLLH
jgi:flavin-dependent dehydrogenase